MLVILHSTGGRRIKYVEATGGEMAGAISTEAESWLKHLYAQLECARQIQRQLRRQNNK